ncbi:DUF2550 domain-containing protein [Allorhizocola rhizosphaerae]|uniref:DUF2550 domain-containing protein n=1 Tax=Allorhizocola rhizosphaerae TaxID=1872709 RepID=UPI000E3BB497|nr:DUF2550 domain-containing protein [Allorhizocola rhizosphaerae]
MRLLEVVAIGLVVLLALMAGVFSRRELFARTKGTVEFYVRLYQRPDGRGWAPGFGQFRGDELRWFRLFSLALRPRRRLSRRGLIVESRRAPTEQEAPLIPAEWVILRCQSGDSFVEVAMPRKTMTGFLSWLESVTPYST